MSLSARLQSLLTPVQGAVTVILILLIALAIWALISPNHIFRTTVAAWFVAP